MKSNIAIVVAVLTIIVIGACAKRSSADEPSAPISAIDAALMQAQ